MAGQRKEGTKRTEFHPDAEDREWLDAQAEAAGMTRNEYLRRMLSDYRNGQVGEVTGEPGTSNELLERMELKMDTLYHGMVAMAQRQEAGLAAIATMAERQEMHEQGMRALASGMQVIADSAVRELPTTEPPALPASESGEDLLPRPDAREREITRYFDAGHEHLQRLMAQGNRQVARRLLGQMRGRYGRECTERELRRRQKR